MDGSALQCSEAARAPEGEGERGTCDAEPENATGLSVRVAHTTSGEFAKVE